MMTELADMDRIMDDIDTESISATISLAFHQNLFREECNQLYIEKNSLESNLILEDILMKFALIDKSSPNESLIKLTVQNRAQFEQKILTQLDSKNICKTLSKHVLHCENDFAELRFNTFKEKLDFKTCVKVEKPLSANIDENNFCCICSEKMSSNQLFEEHLEMHTSISDFEWIRNKKGSPFPRFAIHYQTSEDSRFIKFSVNATYPGIYLNKIVTVRSKEILFLANQNDSETSIDEDTSFEFVIDKNLFIKSVEQPIYVLFNMFANGEQNQKDYFSELHLIRMNIPVPHRKLNLNPKKSELKKKGGLDEHWPRNSLKELYDKDEHFGEEVLSDVSEAFRNFVEESKKDLEPSNISDIYTFLVEMEDIENDKMYRKFMQTNVKISRGKKSGRDFEYFFKLNNLPAEIILQDVISPGDEIIFKFENSIVVNEIFAMGNESKSGKKNARTKFFGVISYIFGTTIFFESRSRGKIDLDKTYNIEFKPNRNNFIYQYAALNAIDEYSLLSLFLFPKDRPFKSPASLSLDIIDPNVQSNPEQKEAAMNIVEGIKEYLPYIIVGPPGTGKTTTIVESVLQVKLNKPEAKILITSGSNAACDEIAKRLIKTINCNFKNIKMLRLYSKTSEKSYEHIDDMLLDASNLVYGHHYYPSLQNIIDNDIVICTTSLVGRLKSSGLEPSSFSYCFIDECAASTEPEVLVAIEAIFHMDINIIIAGDPKQLGPIILSDRAAEYGLKYSFIERLLFRECYRVDPDGTYNRRIQTRLIRNFRTHPDILKISNTLFYSNDLLPCAAQSLTHWSANWYNLPKQNIPLIFHHVNGRTRKDPYSTSLFNSEEVNVVMEYVRKLMYLHVNGRKIYETDIGVISPYRKQNTLIREELDRRNWLKIATGSVETFQGQEKPIIIISTVRSVESDRTGVGFLKNEKRLNVMLTRAQALLIIIGNTDCLSSIENWKECIKYCTEMGVLLNYSNESKCL